MRLPSKPHHPNALLALGRQVHLASATPRVGPCGVRDSSGASGKDVGTHVELRWRHQIIPDSVRLAVGGAALIRDDFLKTAPNATRLGDSYFGYTELLFTF